MSNKIEKILDNNDEDDEEEIPKYKIILLGDSDVGKTSLNFYFIFFTINNI